MESNVTQRLIFSSSFGIKVTKSDKLRAGNYPSGGISVLLPVHRWLVWAQSDSSCCGTGFCLHGSGETREVCCFGRAGPFSRTDGFALPTQRQPGCGAARRAHTVLSECGGYVVGMWWVRGECMVGTWWACDGYMVGTYVVGTWWIHGGYVVAAWWVRGGCMVGTWWVRGGYMVGAWWVRSGYVAPSAALPGCRCAGLRVSFSFLSPPRHGFLSELD